jgi:hypothetical protein
MKKWEKQEALNTISDLIHQLNSVRQSGRKSQDHMRWVTNALRILEEIFGRNSRYFQTLANFSWCETGTKVIHGWDFANQMEQNHVIAFLNQINQAKGLLLAAQDQLKSSNISDVHEGEGKIQVLETSKIITIMNLGEKKLRKLIREKPSKEKEVQDKFEDLLIANEIEYAKEFPHIMYSSKQYIPDFSFEKMNLAVEIKLCKNDEKVLIAQLNDDILAYRTKFKNILFIIYDLGNIRDIDNFKHSFDSDDVIIQVIKH